MRTLLFGIFILTGLLGLALIVAASVGDTSIIAGTGGVYETLAAHGQGENVALRNDLFQVVVQLQWPWAAVQWLGLGVVALAVTGLFVVWRSAE